MKNRSTQLICDEVTTFFPKNTQAPLKASVCLQSLSSGAIGVYRALTLAIFVPRTAVDAVPLLLPLAKPLRDRRFATRAIVEIAVYHLATFDTLWKVRARFREVLLIALGLVPIRVRLKVLSASAVLAR